MEAEFEYFLIDCAKSSHPDSPTIDCRSCNNTNNFKRIDEQRKEQNIFAKNTFNSIIIHGKSQEIKRNPRKK